MKKACLAIILIFMLCVQVLPVSASGQISPFLDGTVSTGSAYLNSSGKGIFRLTVKQEAAEIKVTSCYLYKKDVHRDKHIILKQHSTLMDTLKPILHRL